MLRPSLRATTRVLALAALALALTACALMQADRAVTRSFKYGLVIECRGDVVPSAGGCRELGERVIAASGYPVPPEARRLVLTSADGQCQGTYFARDGTYLDAIGAACQ